MFKVALYGNTLDFYFLKRFDENKKLIDKIDNKVFFATSGILRGNRKNKYNQLQGLPLIENRKIEKYLTFENNNFVGEKDLYLEAGRKFEKFNKPKILFKEQAVEWTDLSISYNPQPSVFVKGVFGISSQNETELKDLFSRVISDMFTYYIFSISGGWGVATHPQTKWEDEYLSFPFIENDNLKQKLVSLVDTFILRLKDYYNLSQEKDSGFQLKIINLRELNLPIYQNILKKINNIIHQIYDIKEHEKDLIDYSLNVSRYQFQESKQDLFTKRVDGEIEFLSKYAEVYLKEFSDIYSDEFIQVEIFPLEHFIAMNFVTRKDRSKETVTFSQNKDVESVLKTLAHTLSISEIISTSDPTKNLFIQKDIKGFEENSFYIIKPNEYKCWHRAMAWYDVAEFKEAIQKAEFDEFYTEVE